MFLDKLPAKPCIIPNSAMILAAGRGERMLPLTERIPKPMLVISGSTILDRAIEHLFKTGIMCSDLAPDSQARATENIIFVIL